MRQSNEIAQEIKARIRTVPQWIWVGLIIVSIFLIVKGALLAQRMTSSVSWPTVYGTITVSDLKKGPFRKDVLKYRNFKPHIVYTYKANGLTYESNRLYFIDPSDGQRRVSEILKTYPLGARVKVYHHPFDPGLSTLEVGFSWKGFKSLLIGVCIAPLSLIGLWRRWSLQTDMMIKRKDPDEPMTASGLVLGFLGLAACIGIAWIWWKLILMYAGR